VSDLNLGQHCIPPPILKNTQQHCNISTNSHNNNNKKTQEKDWGYINILVVRTF
jgi:hypothetical protein